MTIYLLLKMRTCGISSAILYYIKLYTILHVII